MSALNIPCPRGRFLLESPACKNKKQRRSDWGSFCRSRRGGGIGERERPVGRPRKQPKKKRPGVCSKAERAKEKERKTGPPGQSQKFLRSQSVCFGAEGELMARGEFKTGLR